MTATIKMLDGTEATIKDYEWSCDDKLLEKELNLMLKLRGVSGADPDPDFGAAQEAADELGAKIIAHEKPKPLPKGTVI